MHRSRNRFVPVLQLVHSLRPDIADPIRAILERRLLVDGRFVTNPRAMVRSGAPVTLEPVRRLRGEDKLRAALDGFAIDVRDRVCVDIGASAGGFTRVLIERGARRVFAVDAGFGQLRGELRSHSRVVNLERTNIAMLAASPVRCMQVDVMTLDLSYLSVAEAVPQLEAVRMAPDADLVALVKPMYELGLVPARGRTLNPRGARGRRPERRSGGPMAPVRQHVLADQRFARRAGGAASRRPVHHERGRGYSSPVSHEERVRYLSNVVGKARDAVD
jgi:TlyA family rRNA methyltransferase/putative hemolysin